MPKQIWQSEDGTTLDTEVGLKNMRVKKNHKVIWLIIIKQLKIFNAGYHALNIEDSKKVLIYMMNCISNDLIWDQDDFRTHAYQLNSELLILTSRFIGKITNEIQSHNTYLALNCYVVVF